MVIAELMWTYDKVMNWLGRPRLEWKIIDENGKVPQQNLETDAAYDIYSLVDAVIMPVGSVLTAEEKKIAQVRTGIAITAPVGYYFTIEGRSGLGVKEDIVPFRGIIDACYTGELMVKLFNFGAEPYYVKAGDRIAQLILHRCVRKRKLDQVVEFSYDYSHRGTNGFGSSGR